MPAIKPGFTDVLLVDPDDVEVLLGFCEDDTELAVAVEADDADGLVPGGLCVV